MNPAQKQITIRKNIALLIPILLFALTQLASGEFVRHGNPSPDKQCDLQVHRRSEMASLDLLLKKDSKDIWSRHLSESPSDEVRVWWRPDSTMILVQHITAKKECRLSLIRVAKDTAEDFSVTGDTLKDIKSIVAETIVWQKDGSVQFDALTSTGKKRLRIAWSCRLESVEDAARADSTAKPATTGQKQPYRLRKIQDDVEAHKIPTSRSMIRISSC